MSSAEQGGSRGMAEGSAPLPYGADFYRYLDAGSLSSARPIVPLLKRHLNPQSVLDVGCGRGAWLSVWRRTGVSDVFGVDGAHVDLDALLVPRQTFASHDLVKAFDLGRSFDLVQCLEVAEHIPQTSADTLVESLVAHGKIVLFSAATPGQGGVLHVNERSFEYWSGKFEQRNFRRYDFLRPLISGDSAVEPWFRYNTFLFARDDAAAVLPPAVAETLIPRGAKARDYADWRWRLRCRLLAPLPPRLVTLLSRAHFWLIMGLPLRRASRVSHRIGP